ncbi:hypothetical protein BOTNAR_0169g00020 [Botryotinia narcissicola]|uniref:Uncharacterized protein n=1 Tax=Botryotinia narcissicola TaxID=278944 RepID=A0A4Z1ICM0_9HELO|nr:hypothetical protein BOTNAR_0169g00020 [Botryotinia narcissicola]
MQSKNPNVHDPHHYEFLASSKKMLRESLDKYSYMLPDGIMNYSLDLSHSKRLCLAAATYIT